jgi:hypothetical protein
MKEITFGFLMIVILIITSCTNPLDKPLNKDDFEKIKEVVTANENNSPMKSKYIIDNLSMYLGFAEFGKEMQIKESSLPTFREQIIDLSSDFDSIRTAKLEIKVNNEKLNGFIELTGANTLSIDKYKGYLSLKLKFNNDFEKEILYIILNYKYINKYDSKFFDEKTKLTDEVAGDFKGELEISTTEKYNDVSEFMYTKVPVQASKALRDELGVEKANKKVKHEFLMAGLIVETQGVVFKDKTELVNQNADWEYLEN